MTLHQLFTMASKNTTVTDTGVVWLMTPYMRNSGSGVYLTRAEAHKAAAPYRVLFCLTHTYPRRNVEALRAVAERHTRNGGDWRDCARAAINELKKEHTMSKVLIDRELLERAVYHLELAYDAYAPIICDLSSVLSAPSGTPAMPIKAYYHEAPNEYGGFNKSVGLEVRKAFIDAPLVLESDAMECITYLEGEIAKRDARIVELESRYQRDVYGLNNEGDPIGGDPAGGYANDNARLRAELSALKAQEPVQVDCVAVMRADGDGGLEVEWLLEGGTAELMSGMYLCCVGGGTLLFEEGSGHLYAAPVSEAKVQGVVQWPEADEIMQMAFEEGQPADDASGYCFELEEFDLFIERLMSEVARLNATHVQQPKCKTCDDNGRIGGPSFYAPDEGGEPCPDCCSTDQQVSVPASAFASRAITHYEAALLAAFPSGSSGEVFNQWNEARRVLAAAPSAPAADAGLDYQALFDAIAAATSVYANGAVNISVQAFRESLAAHRAKGVV